MQHVLWERSIGEPSWRGMGIELLVVVRSGQSWCDSETSSSYLDGQAREGMYSTEGDALGCKAIYKLYQPDICFVGNLSTKDNDHACGKLLLIEQGSVNYARASHMKQTFKMP